MDRKTPIRRVSKTPKAKLVKECDVLWAKSVKANAGGKCEWCDNPCTDAHHMVGRRRSAFLRHRLENGVALCQSCHFRFHNHESHTGWKRFESDRYDDYSFVIGNISEKHKLRLSDYQEIKEELAA